jgi:hypothetical protein
MTNNGGIQRRPLALSKRLASNLLRPVPIRYREWVRHVIVWRFVLIAASASGSIATVVCIIAGSYSLALRLFIATLIILFGLLREAVGGQR